MKKCTSTDAQHHRLIAALKAGPRNSIQLRRDHEIFSVSSRISDARKKGATIVTHRVDAEGHKQVGLYILKSLPPQE